MKFFYTHKTKKSHITKESLKTFDENTKRNKKENKKENKTVQARKFYNFKKQNVEKCRTFEICFFTVQNSLPN